MNHPSETGTRGIDLSAVDVDPDISVEEALNLADILGADPVYWAPANTGDDGSARIDPDFVVDALSLHRGDYFAILDGLPGEGDDSENDDEPEVVQVITGNLCQPGFRFAPHSVSRGDRLYEEPLDWQQHELGYVGLWQAWLQGRVVPVRRETTYIRQDTGASLEI